LDPIFHQKSVLFSSKKCISFLDGFEWPFGCIFGACWAPFCIQKRAWGEKGDFIKMSVSLTRELNFRGSGPPKSTQKASQNALKKQSVFKMKKK